MPHIDYPTAISESTEKLRELEKRHRYSHLFQRVRMLRLLKSRRAHHLQEAGEGPAIEAIGQPISGAETFAITVEPEGGSEQPTSEPIVTADLTCDA